MSVLRHKNHSAATDLNERLAALQQLLEVGGRRLDQPAADRGRQLVGKVSERLRLSGDRTVAALAGATGSGKSSLFNAVSGAALSQVGIRRPTTATATAAVWSVAGGGAGSDDDPSALLRWLAVQRWHQVPPAAAAGRDLAGLVLLDLPDHDSIEAANRAESDRLVDLVDVFIWVTDPQKYADAALHQRYLAPLAGHDAVTMVVLNQADRLAPEQLVACREDLTRLLRTDGLSRAEVLLTSVATGAGIAELRLRLAEAVRRRTAATARLAADLDALAAELSRSLGQAEADPAAVQRDSGLLTALGQAAGVPTVLAAVDAGYRRDATGAVGWPFTRWLRRFRPDPLRRLRIGSLTGSAVAAARAVDSAGRVAGQIRQAGLQRHTGGPEYPVAGAPAPARTSLPPASTAALAQLDLATRRLGDAAADGLPPKWAEAVRAAARPPQADLVDALDRAVGSVHLQPPKPVWWRVVGTFQWLLAAAAMTGLVWLLVLAILGWLKVPQPDTPYLGPLPWPTLLLVGGAGLGLTTALVLRPVIGVGARRRSEHVRRQLERALSQATDRSILLPVRQVLADHHVAREALAALARRR